MVKNALITVSDKTDLITFAKGLKKLGFNIISSRGNSKLLKKHGLDVTEVSTITNYPPIIGKHGIKLIHPLIFGGILADKKNKEHLRDIKKYKIKPFDIVVCNFYPFEETISKKDFKHEDAIFNLDIGGPAMVRCASKNYKNVAVLVEPSDYKKILDELKTKGETDLNTRKHLALKAFRYVQHYNRVIFKHLSSEFKRDKTYE